MARESLSSRVLEECHELEYILNDVDVEDNEYFALIIGMVRRHVGYIEKHCHTELAKKIRIELPAFVDEPAPTAPERLQPAAVRPVPKPRTRKATGA